MCGRFNLTTTSEQISEHFNLSAVVNHTPNYNITPGQKILTIVRRADGRYKSARLLWGLVPPWSKSPQPTGKMINARAETLAEKPSFRRAFGSQRCLIAATGFYEWQTLEAGKQAFHMHLPGQNLFAFAGLWEQWRDRQQSLYSCTIITTAADARMQAIHARMPVILRQSDYQHWLNPDYPADKLAQLMLNNSPKNLELTAISNYVNNPKHNDPNCLKPC